MLQQLTIKNIALIEDISIEFNNGFNALTGETGAGKSIIIDSLNLVLGERADKELVRTGTNKARVEGIFLIDEKSGISELLEENGIEPEEDQLILPEKVRKAPELPRVQNHNNNSGRNGGGRFRSGPRSYGRGGRR
jgi:DNA repair protein RecN (Recombination protein N)